MPSRIFEAAVRAGIPERIALAIDAEYDAKFEPPARFLERLSVALWDSAAEFGGSRDHWPGDRAAAGEQLVEVEARGTGTVTQLQTTSRGELRVALPDQIALVPRSSVRPARRAAGGAS
jgi:hypothetical protein